jgi:hypothetical protein
MPSAVGRLTFVARTRGRAKRQATKSRTRPKARISTPGVAALTSRGSQLPFWAGWAAHATEDADTDCQVPLWYRGRSLLGADPIPSPSPARGGEQFSPFLPWQGQAAREGGRGVRSSGQFAPQAEHTLGGRSLLGADPTPSPSPRRGGEQFSPFLPWQGQAAREGGRGVRSSGQFAPQAEHTFWYGARFSLGTNAII